MAIQFKVVIAEDEELLLNTIIRKIKEVSDDFIVVGTAQTGASALKLVQELEPDVLITDIRMPVMSGIELLEQITNLYPMMQSVIISGYSDFEYTQSAIRLQVFDYILKPVESDEIKKVLNKLKSNFLADKNEIEKIFTPRLTQESPEKIATVFREYLKNNYTKKISLTLIANDMNYSTSYLTKLFNAQYHMTPSRYITMLRIRRAQQLLNYDMNLSIRQIGEAVGYPEQSYFSRIFKKNVGISPAEYREKL